MPERNPILITGAAGHIGSVSRDMVGMLLEQGHPVSAFVRQDDDRAHSTGLGLQWGSWWHAGARRAALALQADRTCPYRSRPSDPLDPEMHHLGQTSSISEMGLRSTLQRAKASVGSLLL